MRGKEALRDDSVIFINSLYVKPALLFLFAGLFGVLCYKGGGYLTFLNLTDQAFISVCPKFVGNWRVYGERFAIFLLENLKTPLSQVIIPKN